MSRDEGRSTGTDFVVDGVRQWARMGKRTAIRFSRHAYLYPVGEEDWCRHSELNRGPTDYESVALPLSYVGVRSSLYRKRGGQAMVCVEYLWIKARKGVADPCVAAQEG